MVAKTWEDFQGLVERLLKEQGVHQLDVDVRFGGNPENPNIRISNLIMRTYRE